MFANNCTTNQISNLDKIEKLPYSKKYTYTFEELYRISYNFVLYNKSNDIMYLNSSECEIEYLINDNNADIYLKKIYNILDSRNCIFNNIIELNDISLYANKTKKNVSNFLLLLNNLYNKKKYKQNLIILLLQKFNINEDIIKNILFKQIIKNS